MSNNTKCSLDYLNLKTTFLIVLSQYSVIVRISNVLFCCFVSCHNSKDALVHGNVPICVYQTGCTKYLGDNILSFRCLYSKRDFETNSYIFMLVSHVIGVYTTEVLHFNSLSFFTNPALYFIT